MNEFSDLRVVTIYHNPTMTSQPIVTALTYAQKCYLKLCLDILEGNCIMLRFL